MIYAALCAQRIIEVTDSGRLKFSSTKGPWKALWLCQESRQYVQQRYCWIKFHQKYGYYQQTSMILIDHSVDILHFSTRYVAEFINHSWDYDWKGSKSFLKIERVAIKENEILKGSLEKLPKLRKVILVVDAFDSTFCNGTFPPAGMFDMLNTFQKVNMDGWKLCSTCQRWHEADRHKPYKFSRGDLAKGDSVDVYQVQGRDPVKKVDLDAKDIEGPVLREHPRFATELVLSNRSRMEELQNQYARSLPKLTFELGARFIRKA